LRERGEIGTDYAATQLVDYKFTQVEDSYAHNYTPGDIVVPIHDRERLLKGHSYRVERVVEDNLVLIAADGERISTDLAFKKAHYRQAEVGVAVGDRLRWTKNDKSLGRRNGQEFTIAAIADDLASIKYRDGRAEIIDLRQAHHFDLAMATTIYSSQGKTSERVLVAADGIQSAESFYVAASRAVIAILAN
jgi:ATP-dependent exoDNAse (exonuclease V) alpha subunit